MYVVAASKKDATRLASKHSATIRNLINPTRDESLTVNVVTALPPDEIFVTAYPVYDDIVTSGEKSGLEVAMSDDKVTMEKVSADLAPTHDDLGYELSSPESKIFCDERQRLLAPNRHWLQLSDV